MTKDNPFKMSIFDTGAHKSKLFGESALPIVLLPSGSTSCAIFNASVVAMSVLQGTTTRFIVSCFSINFVMSLLI